MQLYLHHATSPEATKPLVKLRNLSSHHTTAPYITQLKSRDFCPHVSQTPFKSCKQNIRKTSPKEVRTLLEWAVELLTKKWDGVYGVKTVMTTMHHVIINFLQFKYISYSYEF